MKDLNEQAKDILKMAENHGVESNFFFITTFKRYQTQIKMLNELEKKINEDGTLVTKEYVKGRKNIYTHPAVSEYNKTTDSANRTVTALIKIMTSLRDKNDENDNDDELLKVLKGGTVD